MNLPDVNRLAGEVVSRDDFGIQARAPEYRQRESSQSNNKAAAALEVVSELAAAIRELEEQPVQAVARAGDRANSIAKQLESEKAKAARAEAAAQELSAALARTCSDCQEPSWMGLIYSRCKVTATTRPNGRRTRENPVRRGCTD